MTFTLSSQTVYTLDGKLGLGTVPEKQLDVDGDAKLRGDVYILGDNSIQGSAVIGQSLFLPNTPEGSTGDLLFLNASGKVERGSRGAFMQEFYKPTFDCSGVTDPIWRNKEGVLYTGYPCPENMRVGINTGFPQHSMDLFGDARITKNLYIGGGNMDNSYKLHLSSGNSGGIRIEGNTNPETVRNALAYSDNGTLRYQLYSTGTIETKLTEDAWGALYIKNYLGDDIFRVNKQGGVTCSKVTVHMVPFPDYVFEKDYKLMPLRELEQYIQRNKHLPNMPSSTDVAKNGADLGEINRVLVEKVEELTLYILDLEQRMNTLEKVSVNK